jgi:hypothetical protein
VLSDFSFEVKYTPSPSNVFADALSWIYSNEAVGTVRSESKHIYEEDTPVTPAALQNLTRPLITGVEAQSEINLQTLYLPADTGTIYTECCAHSLK